MPAAPSSVMLAWRSKVDQAREQTLLAAARGGDRAAIESLLAAHQPRLYRFGLKMCGDPEDAKEVLQDSLLAAARTLPTFKGESSLATWLYTIARSFCIKRRRRGKFRGPTEGSLDVDAAGELALLLDDRPLSDELYARSQLGQAVDRALEQLPPDYREVVVLRDIEGLSAAEAAAVLGIKVQAVKSRLHRARAALRMQLAPVLGEIEAPVTDGCPDILALYSAHLEGEITAETCARMESHLVGCARCRRTCDSLKQVLSVCQLAPAGVPQDVQESVRQELLRVLKPAQATANPLAPGRLPP
jgi:RNA polymerase sigma-70 factor, ECF subfamily